MPRIPLVLGTLAVLHLATPAAHADGQLVVSRGLLSVVRDSAAAVALTVDLQHAPSASRSAAAWTYRIALHVPIAQITRRIELSTQLGHEMVATPANAMGFDPRGAIWEERLTMGGPVHGRWWWSGGVFLRCRHDVDNGPAGDEPTEIDAAPDRVAERRVVVLSGIRLSLRAPELRSPGGRLRVGAESAVERYSGNLDSRAPTNRNPPYWRDARGAWSMTVRASVAGPANTEWFARGWNAAVLFRDGRGGVRSSNRVEAGLRFARSTHPFDVLVAHERTFDDMLSAAPRAARTLYFGMRVASHARS